MDKEVKFRIKIETDGKDVLKTLKIDAEDFNKAIEQTYAETKRLNDAMTSFAMAGMAMRSVQDGLGALRDITSELSEDFRKFDTSMRAANTMAGMGADEFESYRERISELSKTVPLARDELARGLYEVISNGVPQDNWLDFLETSSKSAVGGLAALGDVVTVTSTIVKNYGTEWESAVEIQDKIQTAAKNGKTSFAEMAQALPRVTGNAATLGVSIDELMATFATLTGVSGNTAEVSTQLAAVFTALVKPTSEASDLADQMGVKFDAAAVKAAGGMQNFLTKLTSDISAYASANGMLEQEIYATLFGSAESLRALIPLTGELASTYERNVSAMAESSGATGWAFEEMAGSADAMSQKMRNSMNAAMDWAAGMAAFIEPGLSTIEEVTRLVLSTYVLAKATKAVISAIGLLVSAHKSNIVVSAASAMHTRIVSVAQRLLASSSLTATAGTWALTAAVTALYAALTLGLSALITGLVTLFTSMGDEAEDTAEKTDILKESTDRFNQTVANTKAEMDMELVTLRKLLQGQGDEEKTVEQLNNKYGEALGCHKSAAEWYQVLMKNSKAYCEQLGYEAQAKLLASQIAEKQLEYEAKLKRYTHLGQQSMDKNGKIHYNYETEGGRDEFLKVGQEVSALKSDIDGLQVKFDSALVKMSEAQQQLNGNIDDTTKTINWQKANYTRLGEMIEQQKKKVGQLAGVDETAAKKEAATLRQMEKRYESLGKKYGLSTNNTNDKDKYNGDKLIAEAKSYKELGNNVKYYQNRIDETDKSDTDKIKRLTALKRRCEEAQEEIKALLDAAGRPVSLDSLEDIDKELQYQQHLRQKATADNIAGIDSEIKRLNALKTAIEDSSYAGKDTSTIKTYEELAQQQAYYERRLRTATETERTEIQKRINALEQLKQKWDEALAELEKPGDIGTLDTMEKLDDAIAYYTDRQKKASTEEVTAIQRTIDKLQDKRNALARLTELPRQQRELADIGSLEGTELKLRLELIGLDGVKSKIRSLQEMLDDTENPLSGDERKEVEKLLKSWQGYEKVMKRNSVSVKDTWGHVKGVGSGVEGITDALSGNGRAWERVTGVVDGLIGMWESVKGIIGIVDALTGAVRVQESATISSAAAKQMETTAVVENTAAKSGEAIADATSSGAKLPFPANIAAIAAGVAAVVAALGMIGGAFADGGIVGGSSWRGDRLLVRVNSGEMILNARQQAELFALANGSAMYGGASAVVPQWSGMMSLIGGRPLVQMPDMAVASSPRSVVLKAKGRDLVGVISNERRLTRKRILG